MNKCAIPIFSFCIIGAIVCLFVHFCVIRNIILLVIASIFFLGAAFTFYFFRDPERKILATDDQIVAPADGKIIAIDEYKENGQLFTKISIFLSIVDVHINRAPVAGKIDKLEYHPGKFYVALKEAASTENEQNIITLGSKHGTVIVKQIAGIIARRIVFWKNKGDTVGLGEKIGMIAFGSRTELILPGPIKLHIKINDKVHAGLTIIGEWHEKN